MKRLSLVASLVLFAACSSPEDPRLFARFVNGTQISQTVMLEGLIQRKIQEGSFSPTLAFKQAITAPALGEQRVSVQHPTFADEDLFIYEGSCLTLKVLTRDGLTVGTQKGLVPAQDVECRILRQDSEPGGDEDSVECNGLIIPEEDDEEDPGGDEDSVECTPL
jgi:hypothetical protein